MNLSKLFAIQAEVDEPYEDVPDRLSKDILWLQTELGELANEWRGFRYRRPLEEQQPRTSAYVERRTRYEMGNPLLEEYTDCLSIILSIGLQNGFQNCNKTIHFDYIPDITTTFVEIFISVGDFAAEGEDDFYVVMFGQFLKIGEMLGLTWEQIESNYLQKAEANKRRNAQ